MNGESSRRKAAIWVTVVFLLGIALGVVAGYGYAYRSYAATAAPVTDQAKRARRVEELTRLLGLTGEQQQKLDKALTTFQAEMKEVRRKSEPQLDEVRKRGRAEIRSFLTPEQVPKYDDFVQKLDAERKKNSQ
jgi:Spy/CpxP family protein refolding chaperone